MPFLLRMRVIKVREPFDNPQKACVVCGKNVGAEVNHDPNKDWQKAKRFLRMAVGFPAVDLLRTLPDSKNFNAGGYPQKILDKLSLHLDESCRKNY